MKRLLWLAVLAVPLGACPDRALAWCFNDLFPPMQIDAGVNAHFNVHAFDWNTCGTLGPWYLYFPYEAHFQLPAVCPYPNWPAPMAPETRPGTLPAPPSVGVPAGPPPAGPLLPPTGPFAPPPAPGKGAPPPDRMSRAPANAGPAIQPQAYFSGYPQAPAYRPVSYSYPQTPNYPVAMPLYQVPSYWYGR